MEYNSKIFLYKSNIYKMENKVFSNPICKWTILNFFLKIQVEVICITHSTNTLEKSMTPTSLPPAMGK